MTHGFVHVKIDNRLFYPEVEHPVLQVPVFDESYISGLCDVTTIWHLAYVLDEAEMFKERYENNIRNSNIHNKEFLDQWYSSHLFGQYPKRQIRPEELPKIILQHYGFDKDMFYFMNRGVEAKHFLMTTSLLVQEHSLTAIVPTLMISKQQKTFGLINVYKRTMLSALCSLSSWNSRDS